MAIEFKKGPEIPAIYSKFLQQYAELCSKKCTDVDKKFERFKQDVKEAYATGRLNETLCARLLILKKPTIHANAESHSEEYIRIYELCESMRAECTTLPSDVKADLIEEINLAFDSELISENEKGELLHLVEHAPDRVTPIVEKARAVDVPQRRKKARTTNKDESPRAKELRDEYYGLYMDHGIDVQARTRSWLHRITMAYRRGEISVQEYNSFNSAVESYCYYLIGFKVDTYSKWFAAFRKEMLKMLSSEEQMEDFVQQIAFWAVNHGIDEAEVRNSPSRMALEHLPTYASKGCALTLVSDEHTAVQQLRNLKYS